MSTPTRPSCGPRETPVAHVLVHELAAGWPRYVDQVLGSVACLPPGLLLHLAGRTDEGVRIVELWQSREAAASVASEPLRQAISQVPDAHAPARSVELAVHHSSGEWLHACSCPDRRHGASPTLSSDPEQGVQS